MTIETKYNIGDEVWAMLCDEPVSCRVNAIKSFRSDTHRFIECYLVPNDGSSYGFHEKENKIFPTKEELLKSL